MRRVAAILFISLFASALVANADQAAKTTTVKGWVSDSACAAKGDKKCADKSHIAQGAKIVLVTDGDNKIWTVTNPETLADYQGQHVEVKATTDVEKSTITVQEVKKLDEKK